MPFAATRLNIANMPAWVQDLTLLNPMRYFLVIVRGVSVDLRTMKRIDPPSRWGVEGPDA